MKRLIKKNKNNRRQVRHARVRKGGVQGSAIRPRLSVFRGLKSITLQLIDDEKGHTLCAAGSHEVQKKKMPARHSSEAKSGAGGEGRSGKVAVGYLVGKLLAERAKEKGITRVVFDRAGYHYHGRVKAVAEGAREGGLQF